MLFYLIVYIDGKQEIFYLFGKMLDWMVCYNEARLKRSPSTFPAKDWRLFRDVLRSLNSHGCAQDDDDGGGGGGGGGGGDGGGGGGGAL